MAPDRRLLILLLALALGCGTEKPPRLVLIGIDGGSWNLLDPMIRAGELPNFQALMDRGVSADLASVQPLFSPPVWTSIARAARSRYLERHPPRQVSAAQAPRLPAEPGRSGKPGEVDAETEERLRALGYI